MSVIYEALKKVEASSGGADLKVKPPKKVHSVFKPYLIYVPAICFGLLMGGVLFNYFTVPKKDSADTIIKTPPEQLKPLETAIPPAGEAMPQKKSQPFLILNGIFSSQNEGYALINNRIVKVGDDIEGATVAGINPDSVELEFEGSIISLSSQNN